MNRVRAQRSLFFCGIGAAYFLQLAPLGAIFSSMNPYWLALVLLYWMLETTERTSIGLMFSLGLIADVLVGALLGEQAVRLSILGFIVLRFRARLRFFSLWQQTLAVFALLLNDCFVVLMIRGFAGESMPPVFFWLSPWVGMLVWPFVFLVFDYCRARLRVRES